MKAQFGRYIFLKKLAVGGMAEIFLARRLSFGGFAKFVVLKRLLPEHRGRASYERLFLTEARITAQLDHPNVISLHDLGKLDDAFFMAMEYMHGVSGAELMATAARTKTPIPLGVALRIVIATAHALHYCTETLDVEGRPFGILHHDVSPHNVQIGFDGAVKLLDFGVATQMDRPFPAGRRGKFAYMSPEAIAHKTLDQRSDLFSLGVVLYELTVHRRLFKGHSAAETKAKAEAGTFKKPSVIKSDYSPILEAVVLKMLSRDPKSRYASALTLSNDLEHAARTLKADISAEATVAYLEKLFGDDLSRRRQELHTLAVASTPQKAPPTEASMAELDPIKLAAEIAKTKDETAPQEQEAHEATPDPEEAPEAAPELRLAEADLDKSAAYAEPEDPTGSFVLPPEVNLGDNDDWAALLEAPIRSWRRLTLFVAFLGILAGVGAFFVGQKYTSLQAPDAPLGTLLIESQPSSAKIFNNGKLIGMTPFTTPPAPMGTHYRLRLKRLGYDEWTDTVSLNPSHPHRTITVGLRKMH